MDAVFVDMNGNKKNFLYQYDVGQHIEIENFEYSTPPKVQFQIRSLKTALSVPSILNDKTLSVTIPNILLTYGEEIIAYLYIEDDDSGSVVETVFIYVYPREKPSNYIYTRETFARAVNGVTISDNDGFADVFAWSDENPLNEDRIGYFVNVNSSKTVSKSTSINDVYGVTIDSPGFAAGCGDNMLDKSGYLLSKYAYVRSFGFASVCDDGTCVVGEMCVPNVNGIATKSTNGVGFKVLDRIDDNYIFIFVDVGIGAINSIYEDMSNHINDKSNPHNVTAGLIGLGNVDNTSDKDKPISTATQAALDNKADLNNGVLDSSQLPSHANTHASGGSDALSYSDIGAAAEKHTHTKQEVGLANVDNTADTDKPISTAVQAALDTKATLVDGKISKDILPDDVGGSGNIVVETIADRDALTPSEGLLVHVKDASADESVSSVYADYIFDGDVWVKTGGYTSNGGGGTGTDVGTVAWENIANKPSSFTPKTHASTHAPDGTDPISLTDLGAVSQTDFDNLVAQVQTLSDFVNGLVNVDTKQY